MVDTTENPLEIPAEVQTLGEAITWLRNQRQMSLRALARAVGFSPAFVSDLEHDRRSTDKLDEFANVLGCDPKALREFDKRLTRDLEEWLVDNPQVAPLLRQLKDSERPVELLKLAIRSEDNK